MTDDSVIYTFMLLYTPSPLGGAPILRTREVTVAIQCHYPRSDLSSPPGGAMCLLHLNGGCLKCVFLKESRCEQQDVEADLGAIQSQQSFRGKSPVLPQTHDR